MLALAGCAATGSPAPPEYRQPESAAARPVDVKPTDLSSRREERIVFDLGFVDQQAGIADSSVAFEPVYAEGTLIDLTESPLRNSRQDPCSCLSCSTSSADRCIWGAGCLDRLHQHCRAKFVTCLGCGQECLAEMCLDYQDFYSVRGLSILGLQVGTAAVLANTSLDEDFQDWHDQDVKSHSSDELADSVRWLGEGKIMIPVFAGAALLECFAHDDQPLLQTVGNWGSRCSRSVLVGGPPVLGLAYLMGASRPCEGRGSQWKPFDDNNSVSGHAFIGAVPFLNAAGMTDNVPLKVAFYGLSALPAWSRVNDDRHYLSQAFLGWGIAWLAADVVDRTEDGQQNWVVVPYATDDGMGLQSVVTF